MLDESSPTDYHREQALAWIALADKHGLPEAHAALEIELAKLTLKEKADVFKLASSLERK